MFKIKASPALALTEHFLQIRKNPHIKKWQANDKIGEAALEGRKLGLAHDKRKRFGGHGSPGLRKPIVPPEPR
jgi:hypothetical protein